MTTKQIGDGHAFPCVVGENWYPGMTYRQWLIGMAMQSHVAGLAALQSHAPVDVAEMAITNADAVLEQLAKEGK